MNNPDRRLFWAARLRPRIHSTHLSRLAGSYEGRRLRCERLEDRRLLAVWTVDTNLDVVNAADGKTSLREAIVATNAAAGADEIRFDFGHAGQTTILLTQGELKITDSLTITGQGAELLTIDASGSDPTPELKNGDGSRIFKIDSALESTMFVSSLTLTGGDVSLDGGAVFSTISVSLSDVRLFNNAASRGGGVFATGRRLELNECTVENNQSQREGGGVYAALKDGGELIINLSTLTHNRTTSTADGGGLYATLKNSANIQISKCEISGNTASRDGGGAYILADRNSVVVFTSDRIRDNSGRDGGGLLLNGGRSTTIVVNGSEFVGNHASSVGGGLKLGAFGGSMAIVENSLLLQNIARGSGGGSFVLLLSKGTATIRSATVSGNSAAAGAGIYASEDTSSPAGGETITLQFSSVTKNKTVSPSNGVGAIAASGDRIAVKLDHSIIAGNETAVGNAPDISMGSGATLTANRVLIGNRIGSNLVEAPLGSPDANGNLIGGPLHGIIDPMLGPLADNGGPTLTHAPLPGSPVIDAGDPALLPGVGDTPLFDQRGAPFARVVGSRIDIGAVERLGSPFVVDTLVDESDGNYAKGDLSLREAIELANAQPGADTIEFAVGLTTGRGLILLKRGQLTITESLTINGPIAGTISIDASGNDPTTLKQGDGTRVFNIVPATGVEETDMESPLEVSMSRLSLIGGDEDEDGGAIRSVGELTLTSMYFGNNAARDGGAIWANGHVALVKSTFSTSRAVRGGGVWMAGGQLTVDQSSFGGNGNSASAVGGAIGARGGELRIKSTTFSVNAATQNGGAIAAYDTIGLIENSTFSANKARTGDGGSFYWSGGDLTIRGGRFVLPNNAAARNGGGVYFAAGPGATCDKLSVSGTAFLYDTFGTIPSAAGAGGAIWGAGDISIVDTTFTGATATGDGGGIMIASPAIRTPSLAVIQNSVFNGNSAARGGGIGWDASSIMVVINSAIYDNKARGSSAVPADGAGLFGEGPLVLAHSTVTRNIVQPNSYGGLGGGLRVKLAAISNSIIAQNTGAEGDVSLLPGGHASAAFSFIGFSDGSGLSPAPIDHPDVNGNMIGGPSQLDAMLSQGPPIPLEDSPVIDVGNPAAVVGGGGLSEFDVRHAPFARIFGGRIDIGAYELQPTGGAFTADFNGDELTDGADFLLWQRGVGGSGGKSNGDATGNGVVDGNDLAVWQKRRGTVSQAETLSAPLMNEAASSDEAGAAIAVDSALLAEEQAWHLAGLVRPALRRAYRAELESAASGREEDGVAISADGWGGEVEWLDSAFEELATGPEGV